MAKLLKKIILGISTLFLASVFFWIVFLMNPSLSYAHQTSFGQITVYHNQPLAPQTAETLEEAYRIVQHSKLFDSTISLQLCMNDESNYPELFPMKGGTAYSFWNKAVIFRSKPDFEGNVTVWKWLENKGERRSWKLTELLAHEFVHILQSNQDRLSPLKYEPWKIEGYAEYISRAERAELSDFRSNLHLLRQETSKEQVGIPWIRFEDGTGSPMNYFRYRLCVQYLMEYQDLSYVEMLALDKSQAEIEAEMNKFVE